MRSGTYRGIGIENERLRDWRFALGTIGTSQIFVLLALNEFAHLPLSVSEFISALEISVAVFVASVVSIGVLRLKQGGLGTYVLEWNEDMNSPGVLKLSYTTPKGKRRTGLIVGRVEALPGKPLQMSGRTRYHPVMGVEDTEASVRIDFKNQPKFSLFLSFLNLNDIIKFRDQLR